MAGTRYNQARPLSQTNPIKIKTKIVIYEILFMILLNVLMSVRIAVVGATTTTTTKTITIDNKFIDPISNREKNDSFNQNSNKILNSTSTTPKSYEAEIFKKHDGKVELPKRFDDAQLWRIYDVKRKHDQFSKQLLATILENNYGGNIWKNTLEYLDVSIENGQLIPAQNYLKQFNLKYHVILKNIQNTIDNQLRVAVNLTQNRVQRSTKKVGSNALQWDNYYGTDAIYNFMREMRLKYPKICRLYTIGKTAEGRNLKVLRISENPRDNKKIWIDGGIHAREWVSPSTVTYILNALLTHWDNLPKYMNNKTWYIMPMVNPDGYEYSRTTNRLWRKNRSPSKSHNCFGVDLNRNFDIGWHGKGASDNPCSDIYRGTSPGSELETDAIVKFLSKRKYNLESYLTFHSYGQLIVYPWAYKALKVQDANDLHKIAEEAVQKIKMKTGEMYRAAVTHEVLGIAGGGSDDWARSALSIKYVYTVELRDRGYFGFNLPPDKILVTAIEGYIVVETVAKSIA